MAGGSVLSALSRLREAVEQATEGRASRRGLRVLACGGRDFNDTGLVRETLDRLHAQRGVSLLIHGAARGADRMAGEWAKSAGVPVLTFPADWDRHGRGAGPIRNARMLREGSPNYVVAFPGGRGTADMVLRSKDAGLPVEEV
jgi:hypothetical protein